jgi:metal-responsive CopG/Arc/MetJ family transcriptional regulator
MPEELVVELDTVAIRRDISRAELIRQACREKLARIADEESADRAAVSSAPKGAAKRGKKSAPKASRKASVKARKS